MKIINLGCGNEKYGDVRVDFVNTDATTHVLDLNKPLPFEDGEFDEVYCKSVLEHIGDLKSFIAECFRILKVGGKIWIRTDNASYLVFLFKDHQSYIKYEDYASSDDKHYYLFKEEHLRNLFKQFKDLKINFSCPNNKLFFFCEKLKSMHIELEAVK